VRAVVTNGKKIGAYLGRVAVRSSGSFNIQEPERSFRVFLTKSADVGSGETDTGMRSKPLNERKAHSFPALTPRFPVRAEDEKDCKKADGDVQDYRFQGD
jgi:hypothetical protein